MVAFLKRVSALGAIAFNKTIVKPGIIECKSKRLCKPFYVGKQLLFGLQFKMQQIAQAVFFNPVFSRGQGTKRFDPVPLKRLQAQRPEDNGTFILPMQQAFIKDQRIMDSTVRLISLLCGWAGNHQPIETTQGILAKHIGKSVRQIQRILNDAWRAGYLTYSYTKSRIGMITGIRIHLNYSLIRKSKNGTQKRRTSATPLTTDTNRNSFIYKKDDALEQRLRSLSKTLGIEYPLE